MAVGAAVGSLFGTGAFGAFTAQVAGAAATVVIEVGAGIARMFSGGMAAARPSATIGPLLYRPEPDRDYVAVQAVVSTPQAPVLVAFQFRLDELLPAAIPVFAAKAAPAVAVS